MTKEKSLEAILVIVTALLVLFLIKSNIYFLYAAVGVGITGILIKPLALLIAKGWFKLGEMLGFIVSKIVLAIVFYFLVVPIAFFHNIFNKDTLKLKRPSKSLWFDRNHKYSSEDLKNIW